MAKIRIRQIDDEAQFPQMGCEPVRSLDEQTGESVPHVAKLPVDEVIALLRKRRAAYGAARSMTVPS